MPPSPSSFLIFPLLSSLLLFHLVFQPSHLLSVAAEATQAPASSSLITHASAIPCDAATLSALLSAVPQPNLSHRDDEGNTPLHASAAAGNTACLQLLLSSGADVTATNNAGSTPLMLAASNGHTPALSALADLSPPSAIHGRSSDGDTCLIMAAAAGHDETALKIIALAADINASNNNGSTPLIAGPAPPYIPSSCHNFTPFHLPPPPHPFALSS